MATEKKLHAIMIAFPYQGHITPFISLALKLASNGCTITFVHTQHSDHIISKAYKKDNNTGHGDDTVHLFSKACESGLDIRYRTIYDGFSNEYDRWLNFAEYWQSLLADFPSRVDELVGDIIRESDDDESLVPFLVADTFYSWPATVAKKYNLVNVSLWTQPAQVYSINYHWDLLTQNGHFQYKGNREDVIDYIPGVTPLKIKDLMSFLQDPERDAGPEFDTVIQISYQGFEQVKYADFILMNTVHELEEETISYLNQKAPTFAVGPIGFWTDFTKTVVPKSLWAESDCSKWLDSKPDGSVLYVSFGSLAGSNKELAEAIAHGLMLSEVNFIWVLRDGTGVLPDGFIDDVGDRGLFITWCNQTVVLSDPAVGGFLTHCGWNSTVESIWCGVPMICYPFLADQPTNRKLVVDDWKVGISLCDGIVVTREEVEEKIKRLMNTESSKAMRNNIKKLSNMFRDAVGDGGSSIKSFDKFFVQLRDKVRVNSNGNPAEAAIV